MRLTCLFTHWSGSHRGHPKGYTATDILSRFKRAIRQRPSPTGWCLGHHRAIYVGYWKWPGRIHSGKHCQLQTSINALILYDWDREVNTSDQTTTNGRNGFSLSLRKALAYEAEVPVNGLKNWEQPQRRSSSRWNIWAWWLLSCP